LGLYGTFFFVAAFPGDTLAAIGNDVDVVDVDDVIEEADFVNKGQFLADDPNPNPKALLNADEYAIIDETSKRI